MSKKKVRISEEVVDRQETLGVEGDAIYWRKCRKPAVMTMSAILIFVSVTMEVTLLWHRIAWGFEEWIHEVTFFNFWHGTYVLISAFALDILTCCLTIWSIIRLSIPGLAVSCVMHGTTLLLMFVGCVAMMSDAFTTRTEWIGRMILDLMDPIKYNHNYLKDSFLSTLYWMVECCGADSYHDYPDRFGISPPEGCINRKHAGGLYYEKGCSEKFSVWLKAWAGGLSCLVFVLAIVEVLVIIWQYQFIKILKLAHARVQEKKIMKTPPRTRKYSMEQIPSEHKVPLIQRTPEQVKKIEDRLVQATNSPAFVTSPKTHRLSIVEGNPRGWSNGNLQSGNIRMVSAKSFPENLATLEDVIPVVPARSTSLRQYPRKRSHTSSDTDQHETTSETIVADDLKFRANPVQVPETIFERRQIVPHAKSMDNLSSNKRNLIGSQQVNRTGIARSGAQVAEFTEKQNHRIEQPIIEIHQTDRGSGRSRMDMRLAQRQRNTEMFDSTSADSSSDVSPGRPKHTYEVINQTKDAEILPKSGQNEAIGRNVTTQRGQNMSSGNLAVGDYEIPPKTITLKPVEEGGIPYGYENLLPTKKPYLDDKSVINSIVYDKSYNTDTSTVTTTTATSEVSSSDDDKKSRHAKSRSYHLRFQLPRRKPRTKRNRKSLQSVREQEEDEYNRKLQLHKRDGHTLFETSL